MNGLLLKPILMETTTETQPEPSCKLVRRLIVPDKGICITWCDHELAVTITDAMLWHSDSVARVVHIGEKTAAAIETAAKARSDMLSSLKALNAVSKKFEQAPH